MHRHFFFILNNFNSTLQMILFVGCPPCCFPRAHTVTQMHKRHSFVIFTCSVCRQQNQHKEAHLQHIRVRTCKLIDGDSNIVTVLRCRAPDLLLSPAALLAHITFILIHILSLPLPHKPRATKATLFFKTVFGCEINFSQQRWIPFAGLFTFPHLSYKAVFLLSELYNPNQGNPFKIHSAIWKICGIQLENKYPVLEFMHFALALYLWCSTVYSTKYLSSTWCSYCVYVWM